MDAALDSPHGPIWQGARVLMEDDDSNLRGILRRLLEVEGFHVKELPTASRPSAALFCMSADPDAVPYIESTDAPVRVLLKPFTADDLYHAGRDTITRATDLAAIAEGGNRAGARRIEPARVSTGSESYDAGADARSRCCGS